MSHGITGVLCYGGGIYLQALEGGRKQVNDLYTLIVKDPRHKDVVLLHYEEISPSVALVVGPWAKCVWTSSTQALC